MDRNRFIANIYFNEIEDHGIFQEVLLEIMDEYAIQLYTIENWGIAPDQLKEITNKFRSKIKGR